VPLEFIKNSAAVCPSDKLPLTFFGQIYGKEIDGSGILQEFLSKVHSQTQLDSPFDCIRNLA
jgi:hypothetical protein